MASKKVIIALLMATVIASGCADSDADVTAAAEALPQVQEFLDENPDADITAVRWNSDYLQDNQDQIPEKCMPAIDMEKDHYKVDIQDEEEQINVWLGAEQKEVKCIIREGSESTTNESSNTNSEDNNTESNTQITSENTSQTQEAINCDDAVLEIRSAYWNTSHITITLRNKGSQDLSDISVVAMNEKSIIMNQDSGISLSSGNINDLALSTSEEPSTIRATSGECPSVKASTSDINSETDPVDMTPEESFKQISNDLDLDTETVMQCYEESENNEAISDRENAVSNLGNFGTPTFFVGNREKGFVKIEGAQPLEEFEKAFSTVRKDNPNSSEDVNMVSLEGIDIEGEPNIGEDDAPIKVIEYNDYGCPFCAEWNGIDASSRIPIDQMDVAGTIESQYVETGEVQLIVKDYPVPQLHPNASKAHKAANCVFENEQDSYWEFHNQLFERRDQWMQN